MRRSLVPVVALALAGCAGDRLDDAAITSDFHRAARGDSIDPIKVDRILEIRIEDERSDQFVARVYFTGTCGRAGHCKPGTHQQMTYRRSGPSGAWRLAFTGLAGEKR